MITRTRLLHLQEMMGAEGLDVLLLQNVDEYHASSVHASRARVKWLSGFTGSNAFLAIFRQGKSKFFTDSRYTIQASFEVNQDDYDICDESPAEWLERNIPHDFTVGYYGDLCTLRQIKRLGKLTLKMLPEIGLDRLWSRPMKIKQRVVSHLDKYSGRSSLDKRLSIASCIATCGDVMLITDVEAISWLLNIRNLEFDHDPAVLARAILRNNGDVDLFIDGVDQVHLDDKSIHVFELSTLHSALESTGGVIIDESTIPMSIYDAIKEKVTQINTSDPCTMPKAVKNDVEIEGMRKAHIRDGVAVTNFLFWLDREISSGSVITELDAVKKIYEFRQKNDLFLGTSFETIAGYGSNGAIVHYRASEATNKVLARGSIFLLDSGGQYFDGTTDITRTVAIGAPSDEHVKHFTLVLKGHIALARAVFPAGTSGGALDVLARQYLWQEKLNYGHGTGHGVGSFLFVHEGPQCISAGNTVPLQVGMVLSNEPGYYKEGEYGIRIENLMCVQRASNGFMQFAQLTCVPIDRRLIDISMLSLDEIEYLNGYHAFVWDKLEPHISCSDTRQWLHDACKSLIQ